MEVGFNQHIGVFKNAFSKEYCNKVIHQFEELDELGYAVARQQYQDAPRSEKDDKAIDTTAIDCLCDEVNLKSFYHAITKEFNEVFADCYNLYQDEYFFLRDFAPQFVHTNKIQRTKEGQGFHVWHTENQSPQTATRIGTYILYLNDIKEGGETEFLYQKLRIKPEAGKLVIFPAGITHIHRGNPSLKGTKYIATGWIEY